MGQLSTLRPIGGGGGGIQNWTVTPVSAPHSVLDQYNVNSYNSGTGLLTSNDVSASLNVVDGAVVTFDDPTALNTLFNRFVSMNLGAGHNPSVIAMAGFINTGVTAAEIRQTLQAAFLNNPAGMPVSVKLITSALWFSAFGYQVSSFAFDGVTIFSGSNNISTAPDGTNFLVTVLSTLMNDNGFGSKTPASVGTRSSDGNTTFTKMSGVSTTSIDESFVGTGFYTGVSMRPFFAVFSLNMGGGHISGTFSGQFELTPTLTNVVVPASSAFDLQFAPTSQTQFDSLYPEPHNGLDLLVQATFPNGTAVNSQYRIVGTGSPYGNAVVAGDIIVVDDIGLGTESFRIDVPITPPSATDIPYDNGTSGLAAVTSQGAIDEVAGKTAGLPLKTTDDFGGVAITSVGIVPSQTFGILGDSLTNSVDDWTLTNSVGTQAAVAGNLPSFQLNSTSFGVVGPFFVGAIVPTSPALSNFQFLFMNGDALWDNLLTELFAPNKRLTDTINVGVDAATGGITIIYLRNGRGVRTKVIAGAGALIAGDVVNVGLKRGAIIGEFTQTYVLYQKNSDPVLEIPFTFHTPEDGWRPVITVDGAASGANVTFSMGGTLSAGPPVSRFFGTTTVPNVAPKAGNRFIATKSFGGTVFDSEVIEEGDLFEVRDEVTLDSLVVPGRRRQIVVDERIKTYTSRTNSLHGPTDGGTVISGVRDTLTVIDLGLVTTSLTIVPPEELRGGERWTLVLKTGNGTASLTINDTSLNALPIPTVVPTGSESYDFVKQYNTYNFLRVR